MITAVIEININDRYISVWFSEMPKGSNRLNRAITAVTARPKGKAFDNAVFKKLPDNLLVSDSAIVIKEGYASINASTSVI